MKLALVSLFVLCAACSKKEQPAPAAGSGSAPAVASGMAAAIASGSAMGSGSAVGSGSAMGSGSGSAEAPPAPYTPAADVPQPLKDAIAAADRTVADRRLDAGRKPGETLAFFGIAPGQKIGELFAGGGYTTEVMA